MFFRDARRKAKQFDQLAFEQELEEAKAEALEDTSGYTLVLEMVEGEPVALTYTFCGIAKKLYWFEEYSEIMKYNSESVMQDFGEGYVRDGLVYTQDNLKSYPLYQVKSITKEFM